jgi:aspartyl-tRNA(Asn)/glutamyl-tRNA(Gln) amidotransferase subunit B
MNFEAIIGLEIHVEMQTKTKMFSSAPVTYKATPNSAVVPLDLGHPGTLPVVNEQAIMNAIQVCSALHLTIDSTLHFDRKNYFYADLPKGYQITQQRRPIGSEGFVDVPTSTGPYRIRIERLHVEEDTAMQHHYHDMSLVDYNRAGIPLMEIVTYPDIRTGEQAAAFVETIRQIVSFTRVSSGKLEEGSLRCDVNISMRPIGQVTFGTKVEIKNLNSIANVQRAIEFEMLRQERLYLSGQSVQQETRRFDEAKKETVLMRLKTDAVDYKYFPEPNLVPIQLSQAFIDHTLQSRPELASSKRERYVTTYGLSEYDAQLLTKDVDIATYFDQCTEFGQAYKLYANWILQDLTSVLNKNQTSITTFPVQPERLTRMITLIEQGLLSNKQAKELFEILQTDDRPPHLVAEEKKMLQISDRTIIQPEIDAILIAFPQSIIDFKEGKDRAVGFLIGQLMKKTGGRFNPGLTNQLLLETLKKQ